MFGRGGVSKLELVPVPFLTSQRAKLYVAAPFQNCSIRFVKRFIVRLQTDNHQYFSSVNSAEYGPFQNNGPRPVMKNPKSSEKLNNCEGHMLFDNLFTFCRDVKIRLENPK